MVENRLKTKNHLLHELVNDRLFTPPTFAACGVGMGEGRCLWERKAEVGSLQALLTTCQPEVALEQPQRTERDTRTSVLAGFMKAKNIWSLFPSPLYPANPIQRNLHSVLAVS